MGPFDGESRFPDGAEQSNKQTLAFFVSFQIISPGEVFYYNFTLSTYYDTSHTQVPHLGNYFFEFEFEIPTRVEKHQFPSILIGVLTGCGGRLILASFGGCYSCFLFSCYADYIHPYVYLSTVCVNKFTNAMPWVHFDTFFLFRRIPCPSFFFFKRETKSE